MTSKFKELKSLIKLTPGFFPISNVPNLEKPSASAPFFEAILKSSSVLKCEFFFIINNSSSIDKLLFDAKLSVPTQSLSTLNIE